MEDVEQPVEVAEEVVTETTEVTAAPEATEAQSPVEYELPDGRKVDADTLAKEWKDNFLPEFTRKSQELSAIKAKQPETPAPVTPAWENPDWQPENYKDFGTQTAEQAAFLAEQRVWEKILNESGREAREAEERAAIVAREVEEIRALDPKADVNRVMSHAAKYAFASLIPAYQNMKAIDDAVARTEERVMKNIQARSGEPVGVTGGAKGGTPTFPPGVNSPIEKARWLLRNNK